MIKIKIPHKVIVRAPGLLPMLYTLKELSSSLGLPYNTLRGWLSAGAPSEKDDQGRVWINGELFAAWVKNQKPVKTKGKMARDEGYCLRCNQKILIQNPEIQTVKGNLKRLRGLCPVCGGIVNRGIRDA